ncbi:MAG: winged helix-turn-helix domain-containing protein [Pseudomonadota bacterium]
MEIRDEPIKLGPWEFSPSAKRLQQAGVVRELEPLAAELLAYLASRAGEVVSLDDLHGQLWANRIVTDSSIYRQIAELRRLLGDDARAPSYIETVRKRGYRLVATVDTAGSAVAAKPIASSGSTVVWSATVLTLAVLPVEPLTPAIPVHQVRALTALLTDQLAVLKQFRVISEWSVRSFLRTERDWSVLADRFGVHRFVTGSLAPAASADALELSLAVVDAATGEQCATLVHLLDREFAAADAGAVVTALVQALTGNDRDVSRSPLLPGESSPLLLGAQEVLNTGYQESNLRRAIDGFSAALNENPESVAALAGRATASLRLYYNYFDRSDARLGFARADIDQALSIDSTSAVALYAAGYYQTAVGDADQALTLLTHSLERKPSFSDPWQAIGRIATRSNDFPLALEAFQRATQLAPLNALATYDRGLAEFVMGRYRSAYHSLKHAIELEPGFEAAYFSAAHLALAWLGDRREASRLLLALADQTDRESVVRALLLPGLANFFVLVLEVFAEQLRSWSTTEQGGDSGTWHLVMAEIAAADGELSLAHRHYREVIRLREQALEVQPTDPWYYTELAQAQAGIGDDAGARRSMDRMLTVAPVEADAYQNVDFLWHRAFVLVMLEDYDGAVTAARTASAYFSTTTPMYLRHYPRWEPMFERADFRVLMDEAQSRWRALDSRSDRPGELEPKLSELIRTRS